MVAILLYKTPVLSNQIINSKEDMSFYKHDNMKRVLHLSDVIDVIALTSIIPKIN